MYQFTATERNNEKASEYETKALLYLFGMHEDSNHIELFIVDCFNDVSGSNGNVQRLWDVQSKGIKALNPTAVGVALITLYHNYISDIDFEHYILFMPKLKEMYLKEQERTCFKMNNFKSQYTEKVKYGLKKEYIRRNGLEPEDAQLNSFLQLVEFVIAKEQKKEYIQKITSFRKSYELEEEFYNVVFDEIRNRQTVLKTKNIEGYQIMNAIEVLQYGKILWKKDIDELVINRILGMELFNPKHVPNSFIDEIASLDIEQRKDVIQECQSDIAKLLFNKNGRQRFWEFFGRILSYSELIKTDSSRGIAERIKKDNVVIPKILGYTSVVYLISALKEGLMDDN